MNIKELRAQIVLKLLRFPA